MAHPTHGRIYRFRSLCYVCVFSSYFRARCVFLTPVSPFCSIGVTLALVIPRVPDFAIRGSTPLTSATGWFNQSITAQFSRAPANFTFPANIQLQVDTNSNFLPLVFKHLDAQVYDLDSFHVLAIGHLNRTKLPAKQFINIQMPLNFSYVATNDSDLTCQSTISYCVFLPLLNCLTLLQGFTGTMLAKTGFSTQMGLGQVRLFFTLVYSTA